jgi:hypothetical protein
MPSNREKMMAVYRNRLPRGIPLACYSFMLPNGRSERIARENGLGIIDHFPGVTLVSPPYFARYECLSNVKNSEFSISYYWDAHELVEVHKYATPVGEVTQHVAKEPGYGSYYRKKHYITEDEDYRIVQYIVENTIFRQCSQALSKRKKELGEDGVIFSRLDRSPYQKLLIELARPEKFLVDLHEVPGLVEPLLEALGDRLKEQFNMALDSEAEIIWAPDNITCDMTPPGSFEKYLVPFYNRFGRGCEDAGKVFAVHMDGKLDGLKDIISKTAIHVIESFSLPEIGGNIPAHKIKDTFPNQVVCPNFPSSISFMNKDEIKAYLRNLFQAFGRTKPFMLQISEDIPAQLLDHVLETLNEFVREQETA